MASRTDIFFVFVFFFQFCHSIIIIWNSLTKEYFCLIKSEVSIERISVFNVNEKIIGA